MNRFVLISKFHIRSGFRLKNNYIVDGLEVSDVVAIGLVKIDVLSQDINNEH